MHAPTMQPQEIEAKFQVHDARLVTWLGAENASLPGYDFAGATEHDVVDLYVDTADYLLLRSGYQLRLRIKNGQRLITLKSRSLDAAPVLFCRLELEVDYSLAQNPICLADLPEVIAAALAPVLDERSALTTLCALVQRRQTRAVHAARSDDMPDDLGPLAIMSLDNVFIRRRLDAPDLARFQELELELCAGVDAAELQVLSERFRKAFRLTASSVSKLEYTLGVLSRHLEASPPDWQGIRPEMPLAEACRLLWQEQFMVMLLAEAGVRYTDDPEFVHDMRVAIRRMRAAERLYGHFFKPKTRRWLLKPLRRTARLLGEVRDLDVAMAKLQRYQQKPVTRKNSELAQRLDLWAEQRAEAHNRLVAWLEGDKYAKFVCKFSEFCRTAGAGVFVNDPAPGEDAPPFQVRHVAPSMVLSSFERVRSFEIWFESDAEVAVETLHRLRIACKYLRYNLEFVRTLLGEEAEKVLVALRSLQEDLGELNDAAVSKRMLIEVEGGKRSSDVTRYQQVQDRLIDRLEARARKDFSHLVAAESRQRLLLALARI